MAVALQLGLANSSGNCMGALQLPPHSVTLASCSVASGSIKECVRASQKRVADAYGDVRRLPGQAACRRSATTAIGARGCAQSRRAGEIPPPSAFSAARPHSRTRPCSAGSGKDYAYKAYGAGKDWRRTIAAPLTMFY
eukprot:350228-Chlamydomonas_euryale.AAC.9